MLNAYPFDTDEKHARIGQRPGLKAVFETAGGVPWKAPSYIQGFGRVDIAAQTRFEPGGAVDELL